MCTNDKVVERELRNLTVEASMKLKFGGQLIEPDVRRLYDLRDVAFDSAWFEAAPDRDAYYMYRDLALSLTDAEAITRHQLRYDITIIPPFNMGLE
ncbi:MAG: glucose-6-phosphate isomerase family protein, partial [Halobacteriota archaeon]